MRILVFLLFLLFIAGVIALQIFLSKMESKLAGLVLPIITILLSLMYPLGMVAPSEGVTAGFIVGTIIGWLICNIPTIVFLAIYFGCREKQRRNKQLDKMNIQDLN